MSSIDLAKKFKKGKKSQLAAGASGLTQGSEKVG
jgi:hypothetical protein